MLDFQRYNRFRDVFDFYHFDKCLKRPVVDFRYASGNMWLLPVGKFFPHIESEWEGVLFNNKIKDVSL